MLAKDLFNEEVIPAKTTDIGDTVLSLMEELKVSHLPVVSEGRLVGLISETDIYNADKPDTPIGKYRLTLPKPYVLPSQHYYDVIRVATTGNLTLVPVTDENDNYLGCITLLRIVDMLAELSSVRQPGGIIVLEVNSHNYSMSEIARIVESNDARVLSTFITSFPDSTRLEVTIKVNKIDLSPIIQTFNRYNYIITASFSEESQLDELLHSRYESLMNYLNI